MKCCMCGAESPYGKSSVDDLSNDGQTRLQKCPCGCSITNAEFCSMLRQDCIEEIRKAKNMGEVNEALKNFEEAEARNVEGFFKDFKIGKG